jgi:hypothetical protein
MMLFGPEPVSRTLFLSTTDMYFQKNESCPIGSKTCYREDGQSVTAARMKQNFSLCPVRWSGNEGAHRGSVKYRHPS